MSRKAITHITYSDETNHNRGQYRAIAVVTMPLAASDVVTSHVQEILDTSRIKEFKWEKLRSHRYRDAAHQMLDFVVNCAVAKTIRLDVLMWDIRDSRHDVSGRDDFANFHRMYYHVLHNVLRNRWTRGSRWRLCPDEHTGMNWESIGEYLESKGNIAMLVGDSGVDMHSLRLVVRQEFGIAEISARHSHLEPALQIADLCAGLCVYSRASFGAYESWISNRDDTDIVRPHLGSGARGLSGADEVRCEVLDQFNANCKLHKLYVSLNEFRGLRTRNPSYPINFWWWESQHEMDKAPTRH